jgi:hypothetical protein
MSASTDDSLERAQAIYEDRIRPHMEPKHRGEYLVINLETGDYEVDADDLAASRRAKMRFPGAPLFTMRVGREATYRIGARRNLGIQG